MTKDTGVYSNSVEFEVEVYPNVYWVPLNTLGKSRYTDVDMQSIIYMRQYNSFKHPIFKELSTILTIGLTKPLSGRYIKIPKMPLIPIMGAVHRIQTGLPIFFRENISPSIVFVMPMKTATDILQAALNKTTGFTF